MAFSFVASRFLPRRWIRPLSLHHFHGFTFAPLDLFFKLRRLPKPHFLASLRLLRSQSCNSKGYRKRVYSLGNYLRAMLPEHHYSPTKKTRRGAKKWWKASSATHKQSSRKVVNLVVSSHASNHNKYIFISNLVWSIRDITRPFFLQHTAWTNQVSRYLFFSKLYVTK